MVIKSLRTFFLLLASLAIVVHMIIPHDHHLSDPIKGQKDSCPVSGDKSGHHTGLPIHCHAFNDLAAEKFRTFHVSQFIQFNFITCSILTNFFAFKVQSSCKNLIDFSEQIFDSYILEFSLLRAPPALA